MIFVNAIYKENQVPTEYAEGLVKMLNPFSPFVTEEIWNKFLKHNETITYEPWPIFNAEKAISDEITLPIQFNGKLKGTIQIAVDEDEYTIKEKVHEAVLDKLDGKTIVKEIYVKNKIYNIVVK